MKKYYLSLLLITIVNSWSLSSLWDYTKKHAPSSTKYYFLMDPDDLLLSEDRETIERNLVFLYSQYTIYAYFFVVKELNSPSIDDEYLTSFVDSLSERIEKNINSNMKNSFVSIITKDKYFKYKFGNGINPSKKELERMFSSTKQKLREEKDLSKTILNQISNIEYIVDIEDDVIPGWDDDDFPIHDPDDLDDPSKYLDDIIPHDDLYPTNTTKTSGTGIFIVIIICLIFLILFLIWLFFSLAKRVRKMSSNNINYNMFSSGTMPLQ